MVITDQIRDLADRIQSELNRGSDYYSPAKLSWRLTERFARRGRTFRVENADTGNKIDGNALSGLTQNYVSGYPAESVFQHYVSLLEDYLFGLIGLWLMANPKGLVGLDDDKSDDHLRKSDRLVPLSFITDNPDRESILRAVVDRELDRLKYRRLAAWFGYLEKRARLGTPSRDGILRLAEIKASRDLLIHNRGIVNPTYLSKAGPEARYPEGARVEIIDPYLRESWLLIIELVRATSTAAIAKFE